MRSIFVVSHQQQKILMPNVSQTTVCVILHDRPVISGPTENAMPCVIPYA